MIISPSWYIVIDIILVALLIMNILVGIKKGFIIQLIECIGLIIAIFIAWLFAPVLAGVLDFYPHGWVPFQNPTIQAILYPYFNGITWFILIFVVVKIILLLLKPFVKALGEFPILKQVNEFAGGVFSVLYSFLWFSIIAMVLSSTLFINGNQIISGTLLRYPVYVTNKVFSYFDHQLELNPEIMEQLVENVGNISELEREKLKDWLSSNQVNEEKLAEIFNK